MNSNKIFVSIILPCYNIGKYIEPCLDSLRAQTLGDIEIICVDDLSTDNTVSIIRQYMKQDDRIRLIQHRENRGVGAARNSGRKVATGQYVSFIDPDDYVDTDFFEKLYSCAHKNNLDVAKAGVKRENLSTRKTDTSETNDKIRLNRIYFAIEHWSAIYKREFLDTNNIYYPEDVPTGQDVVFLSHIALMQPRVGVVDDTYYHYILNRPGSLDSKALSHDKVLSRIKMLEYKVELLNRHEIQDSQARKIYLERHLLDHFMYTFNKSMDKVDKRLMFDWLYQNKDLLTRELLATSYTEYMLNALYSKNFKRFVLPEYKTRLFFKERRPSGTRRIYFCGIKIYSYKKKRKNKCNAFASPDSNLNYKTYNDLAMDIKANIAMIPTDIDLVVGIPRSGMIPAYMVGLALNKKVCSVAELLNGILGNKGYTRPVQEKPIKKILVIDDTVNSGQSLLKVRQLLKPLENKYQFCFMAIYGADQKSAGFVDVCLKILEQPRIFQWNYMYHSVIQNACFDMDGVLCCDPTEEENDDGEKYIKFIKTAQPLYVPNRPIGYIVTSRLEKYRIHTEQWLKDHGIVYKKLYMLNSTAEERRRLNLHAKFKSKIYNKIKDSGLFIESDPYQAQEIAKLTGKRCVCCTTDTMYEK